MTARLAGGTLAALLAVGAPPAARAEGVSWAARYGVRFTASAAGVPGADVEATLRWIGPASERPSFVTVGMADDGFPGGYGAFVRAFRSVGSGAPAPAAGPEGGYRLPVSTRGLVSFAYSVVLEHDASGWGPGPDEAPYRAGRGAFWTGRALFVTAPGSRAEVAFTLPAGDHLFTSYTPAGRGRPLTFTVPSDERLRESFLVVGRPVSAELRVGEATVTLVLGGGLEESLPLMEESVARFLAAAGALFGGAPPGRTLVVGDGGGRQGSFDGGVFGDDVSMRVDEPFTAANAGRWQPFLAHELFHLWNGRALDFVGQQYWMSEGFTDYYARALLLRAGALTPAAFAGELEQRAVRYLSAGTGVGLLAAGDAKFENKALVYDGGMLAALCLDLRIRAATANRRTLDDVMRALYRRAVGPPRALVTTADVVRTLSAVAGVPFESFFNRHVTGRDTLPLADALALGGMGFEATTRDLPPLRWVTSGLLMAPSITTEAGAGLRVLQSLGDVLREGDLITALEGQPVRTLDDLRFAVGARAPGDTVAVAVVRGGAPLVLALKLAGDSAARPAPTRAVRVRIAPEAEAGPLVQAIRSAVFGPQEGATMRSTR